MVQIWTRFHLDVRKKLRPPQRKETLKEYLQHVDEYKSVLVSIAQSRYPYIKPKEHNAKSNYSKESKSTSNLHDEYRDEYKRKNDRRKDKYYEKSSHDRGRRSNKDRPREGNKDHKDKQWRDRHNRDRDRDRDDYRNRRNRDRERHKSVRAHVVDDDSASSRDDLSSASYDSDSSSGASSVNSANENVAEKIQKEIRKKCRKGKETFSSGNKLQKHLETCPGKKKPAAPAAKETAPKESESSEHVRPRVYPDGDAVSQLMPRKDTQDDSEQVAPEKTVFGKDDVVEDTALTEEKAALFEGYTHLRLNDRPKLNGKEVMICLDTGTGRNLINRAFLRQFEHKVTKVSGGAGGAVRGAFDKRAINLTELATFWFYARGTKADGKPGLVKKKTQA